MPEADPDSLALVPHEVVVPDVEATPIAQILDTSQSAQVFLPLLEPKTSVIQSIDCAARPSTASPDTSKLASRVRFIDGTFRNSTLVVLEVAPPFSTLEASFPSNLEDPKFKASSSKGKRGKRKQGPDKGGPHLSN